MHGWLAFLAGVFVVIGAVLLFAAFTGITYYGMDAQMMIAAAVVLLVIAGIAAWLLYAALRAQYARVKTGEEALIGAKGTAVTDLAPTGEIRVMGEFWRASAKAKPIRAGETVEVVGMDSMFLIVEPAEAKA